MSLVDVREIFMKGQKSNEQFYTIFNAETG